jgi:hypothetical protein
VQRAACRGGEEKMRLTKNGERPPAVDDAAAWPSLMGGKANKTDSAPLEAVPSVPSWGAQGGASIAGAHPPSCDQVMRTSLLSMDSHQAVSRMGALHIHTLLAVGPQG